MLEVQNKTQTRGRHKVIRLVLNFVLKPFRWKSTDPVQVFSSLCWIIIALFLLFSRFEKFLKNSLGKHQWNSNTTLDSWVFHPCSTLSTLNVLNSLLCTSSISTAVRHQKNIAHLILCSKKLNSQHVEQFYLWILKSNSFSFPLRVRHTNCLSHTHTTNHHLK